MQQIAKAFDAAGFDELMRVSWDKESFYFPKLFQDLGSIGFSEYTISAAFRRSSQLLSRTEVVNKEHRKSLSDFGNGADLTPELVLAALSSGAAVIGRRFDQDHDGTAEIQHFLETRIGHPVFATIFITHSPEATFPAHYDSADVIVLQLDGLKRWALLDRVTPPPSSDADVRAVDLGDAEARCTFELRPGDLLYVPRGTVHKVQAVSIPAVHVSFGVKVLTVADLLIQFVREWSSTPEFRTALPPNSDPDWVEKNLSRLLGDFLQAAAKPQSYSELMLALRIVPETFSSKLTGLE